MRLGVQGKVNPNRLMAAALMLPRTCGRNMAVSVSVSPLTTDNYWLRSMWLDVDRSDANSATFIPKDFVFEGGMSKRQGVATEESKLVGDRQFFKLEYAKRVENIISLADDTVLPDFALSSLRFYRDVLLGQTTFEYELAEKMVVKLMRELSRRYPDVYSGYNDPLDLLMELGGKGGNDGATSSTSLEKPLDIHQPRNLIYFGAPGTGKSFRLNRLAVGADGDRGCFDKANVTRVTFHPDYTYAQFVGCFKPFIEPQVDEDSPASSIRYVPGGIEYRFVPGPFINTYVDAIRHPDQNYLLIIEEINRANPASVFGDVFQLLDRKENGTSEYSVATPEDLRWYLFKQWKSYLNGIKPEERQNVLYSLDDPEANEWASSISLPGNMFIWATMNSADQGVFPMDTAFKRRWDFRYMGIDEGSDVIEDIAVPVGTPSRMVGWDALRRGINKVLLNAGVNEDKLLGPFFISPSRLRDADCFIQTFQDKVLLYLFEDAAKTKKSKVFSLVEKVGHHVTYSQVCADFRARGELAFIGMKELACLDEAAFDEKPESDGADGGE